MDPHAYSLWFEHSPFDEEQEELARRAARFVLDKHFGQWNVLAAHDAALATGLPHGGAHERPPKPVSLWLDAIGEAYRAAWSAAGLPPLTAELQRDNPQLNESCVMVGRALPHYAYRVGGLTFRLYDVWVCWSVFEPFDDSTIAHQAHEELWMRLGSQEAVLEARLACEAAGGLFAPEPQPPAVVAWRRQVKLVLESMIQNVVGLDVQAGDRIRSHPDLERCILEVGRCRPQEFGGPEKQDGSDWRLWWVVEDARPLRVRHACGMSFEVDAYMPALSVRRIEDAEVDERLEGGWQVQRLSEVVKRLAAEALQLVLEHRMRSHARVSP
jgi:hypothetical protein